MIRDAIVLAGFAAVLVGLYGIDWRASAIGGGALLLWFGLAYLRARGGG